VTLDEVADLIAAPASELLSTGNYVNRRGILGYFMQVKCGDHWCKVSVSHAERHSDRLSVEELDRIDPTNLRPAVIIPVPSISAALRSSAGRDTPINTYLNAAGIEGIWAEFRFEGNWYMLSVSHIDVPTHASPADLEMIADEFLRQQSHNHGRRRIRW
jgi:hypothetical protein